MKPFYGARLVGGSSATNDPYFANVVALLHMEGTNGSTTFTDVTGKTWTPSGNAQISTAQFPWGTSSGYCDGTGDYITGPTSADFTFGTGDLTIEFMLYRAANVTHNILSVSSNCAIFMNNGSTDVQFQFGGTTLLHSNDNLTALALNTWTHVAVSRQSGVWRMHVGGIYCSNTGVRSDNLGAGDPAIGRRSGSANTFNGYFKEVRLTKGVGRYGAGNITPPTGPWPNS